MDVHVLVTAAGPDGPEAGTPVVVEIRDTSRMDVASTTVSAARTTVGDVDASVATAETGRHVGEDVPERLTVAAADLAVPDDADLRGLTVWARVATSDHEHITSGDWITVQSYPVQTYPVQAHPASSSPSLPDAPAPSAETVVVEVVRV